MSALLKSIAIAAIAVVVVLNAHADAPSGPDFLVGTWTSLGDCGDGEVFQRDGEHFTSTTRGRVAKGDVTREGNILKTSFSAEHGYSKRYEYEIHNDNRLRVVSVTMCDPMTCRVVKVTQPYYLVRCSD